MEECTQASERTRNKRTLPRNFGCKRLRSTRREATPTGFSEDHPAVTEALGEVAQLLISKAEFRTTPLSIRGFHAKLPSSAAVRRHRVDRLFGLISGYGSISDGIHSGRNVQIDLRHRDTDMLWDLCSNGRSLATHGSLKQLRTVVGFGGDLLYYKLRYSALIIVDVWASKSQRRHTKQLEPESKNILLSWAMHWTSILRDGRDSNRLSFWPGFDASLSLLELNFRCVAFPAS